MEHLNNNTNVDNNSNIILDDDKISTIRIILNKLGNIITKKDKKKTKKELYDLKNKKNLSDKE